MRSVEGSDRSRVLQARRTQDEPLRPYTRSTSLPRAFQRNPVGQGRHTGFLKSEEGSRTPVSPLGYPVWGPPVRWDPADLEIKSTVYSAAASVIGSTDTNTLPLALVRNSTRPLIRANRV